jgi:hypothetical protein
MLLVFNRFLKMIAGTAAVLCMLVFERANADQWDPFADLRAVNVAGPYYVTVTLDRHYTIEALHGPGFLKRSPFSASLLKEPEKISAEEWGETVRYYAGRVSPPVPVASTGNGPVEIRMAKRAVEKQAIRPALAWFPGTDLSALPVDREARVDAGDVIISEWILPAPPSHVLVSATGLGVVCVGVHNGYVDVLQDDYAVAILPANGKKELRLRLRDVLTDDEAKLMFAEHGINTTIPHRMDWLRLVWLDEVHRRVFISLTPGPRKPTQWVIKMIDFDTAAVKQATADDVLACVVPENGQALYASIDMAVFLKGEACRAQLRAVVQSTRAPIGARTLSAVYLRDLGDSSGAALIEQMESRARSATKSDPQLRKHLLGTVVVGVYETGFDRAMDEIYAFYLALSGCRRAFLPVTRSTMGRNAAERVRRDSPTEK